MYLKTTLILAFVLMPFLTRSQSLEKYRWKNRILLLCDRSEDHAQSEAQIGRFEEVSKGVEERQLLILVYDGTTLRDRDLNILSPAEINLPEDDFTGVLLIGKDGGIKYKTSFYTDPETIFQIIDSMPMRRAEMKRKID